MPEEKTGCTSKNQQEDTHRSISSFPRKRAFSEGRYFSFQEYCRRTYGRKLWRISLDAGMTCPNRDGTIGTKGCIFCSVGGSGDFAVPYDGQKMHMDDFSWFHGKAEPGDFIAYFQAFTNTYAPIPRLSALFEAALNDPMFAGISIATRPDVMGEDVLTLLEKLKRNYPKKFIWVELGLQTASDSTAIYLRRGYPTAVFEKCAENLSRIGIPFIVHVIIGLPGEGKNELVETIKLVNRSGASGVKLQLLHYLKGTTLGDYYLSQKSEGYQAGGRVIHVLTEEEYLELVCEAVRKLRSDIVIHRITGDGAAEDLLAPMWSKDKKHVLNAIRHELKVRGIFQGQEEENHGSGHIKETVSGT